MRQKMSDERHELWACSHCGLHPSSRAGWCAVGCGRDYNRMYVVGQVGGFYGDPAAAVSDETGAPTDD